MLGREGQIGARHSVRVHARGLSLTEPPVALRRVDQSVDYDVCDMDAVWPELARH